MRGRELTPVCSVGLGTLEVPVPGLPESLMLFVCQVGLRSLAIMVGLALQCTGFWMQRGWPVPQCIAWLPTSVPARVHSIQMLTAAVGLSDPEGKAALRPLIPSHLTWGLSAHTFPHPCSLCLSVTGL